MLQTVFGFATREIGILHAAGAPLVGFYYAAMIPVRIVFLVGSGGAPSSVLHAFWSMTWALLGVRDLL